MEITILSAEGIKNTSFLSSRRFRPFVSISTSPQSPSDKHRHVYQTRIDDSDSGVNPTWGDKFYVPLDAAFFANRSSCIYLQLYTKRMISGKSLIGWCQIPISDVRNPAAGSVQVQYLSYRLRARDGTRDKGILNVSVKLENDDVPVDGVPLDNCQTVIGVPLTVLPRRRVWS